jgi:hypothetical protein
LFAEGLRWLQYNTFRGNLSSFKTLLFFIDGNRFKIAPILGICSIILVSGIFDNFIFISISIPDFVVLPRFTSHEDEHPFHCAHTQPGCGRIVVVVSVSNNADGQAAYRRHRRFDRGFNCELKTENLKTALPKIIDKMQKAMLDLQFTSIACRLYRNLKRQLVPNLCQTARM